MAWGVTTVACAILSQPLKECMTTLLYAHILVVLVINICVNILLRCEGSTELLCTPTL